MEGDVPNENELRDMRSLDSGTLCTPGSLSDPQIT